MDGCGILSLLGEMKHPPRQKGDVCMKVWFDMDGTIADLYGVEGWLDAIICENPMPYLEAKPLVHLSALARQLNAIQRRGIEIGIISWTAKGATARYNEMVKQAKIEWLSKHLKSVVFNEIHIVEYGTPKQIFCSSSADILFDDEKPNREAWTGNARTEKEIFEILKKL